MPLLQRDGERNLLKNIRIPNPNVLFFYSVKFKRQSLKLIKMEAPSTPQKIAFGLFGLMVLALLIIKAYEASSQGSYNNNSINNSTPAPDNYNSSDNSISVTKTCSWCGKKFTGEGYNYVGGDCIQGKGDYYDKCSEKCCNEAKMADPNLSDKWKH
jgi:hypothetical protein